MTGFMAHSPILKNNPALVEKEITAFRTIVDNFFCDNVLPIEFCYRLRLGVMKKKFTIIRVL